MSENRSLLRLAFGNGAYWSRRAGRVLGLAPHTIENIYAGYGRLTRYQRRTIGHYCRQARATVTSSAKRRQAQLQRQIDREMAEMAQAELLCRALDAEMERHEKNKRK